jgi:hypothetical protein
MTATIKTDLVGVRQAVASLNKIEPGLRKQFALELNQIAAPAINEAQRRYTFLAMPLSGMRYKWTEEGRSRPNFPYVVAKAAKGVKVKLDTRRNATSVIVIQQGDAAAGIFETAGRKNSNNLATSLGKTPAQGRTRLFGPAVYSKIREVTKEMERATLRVINRVNRELQ